MTLPVVGVGTILAVIVVVLCVLGVLGVIPASASVLYALMGVTALTRLV